MPMSAHLKWFVWRGEIEFVKGAHAAKDYTTPDMEKLMHSLSKQTVCSNVAVSECNYLTTCSHYTLA